MLGRHGAEPCRIVKGIICEGSAARASIRNSQGSAWARQVRDGAAFLSTGEHEEHMATRNDTNEHNKAAEEAARTTRTVTDEAARVGEQAARAGADVARRGADVARDSFQAG